MSSRKPPIAPPLMEEAVTAALREGHREFLRFVSRRTRSIADAEDVLQDFYVKVIRSARTIKAPGALRGWLAQVLRSTLADHYRRTSVRRSAQQHLLEAEGSGIRVADDAERAVCRCLYRVLPALPADYARVIWQVDLLGQPRNKVARSLGISPNNLGVRIHRARRALRAALERFCITCPIHGFLNCACEEERPTVGEAPSRPGRSAAIAIRRSAVRG